MVVLFALFVYGGMRPHYEGFLWADRKAWNARLSRQPDRHDPSYPDFLRHVEESTTPGSTVLIITPNADWFVQYGYLYFRGMYLLEGRRVLPVVSRSGVVYGDRFRTADYVAAWHMQYTSPIHDTVWTTATASLSRRRP